MALHDVTAWEASSDPAQEVRVTRRITRRIVMAAITSPTSWFEVAQRRFPLSRNRIFGEGPFYLQLCCGARTKLLLFKTAEERNEAWGQYEQKTCGAPMCVHDHKCGVLQ